MLGSAMAQKHQAEQRIRELTALTKPIVRGTS
jgi:hypothetical protein